MQMTEAVKTVATSPARFATTRGVIALIFMMQALNILTLRSASGTMVGGAGLLVLAGWAYVEYRVYRSRRDRDEPDEWEDLPLHRKAMLAARRTANTLMFAAATFVLGIFCYYIIVAG